MKLNLKSRITKSGIYKIVKKKKKVRTKFLK